MDRISRYINVKYLLLPPTAEPVFISDQERPMNLNVMEGQTAIFRCHADAEPSATVQWFINGDPLDRKFSLQFVELHVTTLSY